MLKSALGKIGSGNVQDITDDEAKAMGTFWHEITHNRNVHGNMRTTNLEDSYMELANEFVARHSLSEFYKLLGVENIPWPKYQYNRDDTAYNEMVTNYDYVIKRLGLDFDKTYSSVRDHLFNKKYNDQRTGLMQALLDGGLKYANSTDAVKQSTLNELLELIRTNSGREATRQYRIRKWLTAHGFLT